jgi:hypothetical protein
MQGEHQREENEEYTGVEKHLLGTQETSPRISKYKKSKRARAAQILHDS